MKSQLSINKNTLTLFLFIILVPCALISQTNMICDLSLDSPQNTSSLDSAYTHIKEQFDQYHKVSYVYYDDNCGGNLFIPSIYEGENTKANEAYNDTTYGRSCTKIVLKPTSSFSAVKYVYPENNIGTHQGYDLSNATKLSFKAKGSGIAEFMMGGMNRRPFFPNSLPYQDGADIRSTGFVNLTNNWQDYSINLTDNRFWVYLDSAAGMNNKYCQAAYMGLSTFFNFSYGGDDGQGNKCMKLYWFGGYIGWAGLFLLPPEGNWTGTQGYDLSGINKIRFKAKISTPGNLKFLFGINGDSGGQLSQIIPLTTDWQWYEWDIPLGNYSNTVGGFGFVVESMLGTPNYSTTYIDSVYYEGVELSHDYQNLICGFNVTATHAHNPDSAVIYLDEIKYDKDRTSQFRFSQSYICGNDSIDLRMKNRADVYDNSLKLIADLIKYRQTNGVEIGYLNNAKLVGDAFVYALNHDRFFHDGRLRNSYMSGELKYWNNTVRLPGWWDYSTDSWNEDITCLSTSTGNMAWAGLTLTSLYETTLDNNYLNAAKVIANWCIDNTKTQNGFTGGYIGFDEQQTKMLWKSTEHNIDLYALFKRLFSITAMSKYDTACQNAKNFVYSMWNQTNGHFWTGTDSIGINTNTSNIPLDIQAWYMMAFQDNTSNYSTGINWANIHCQLSDYQSQNYSKNLNGFDFNPDKDGIWFEGTSQAALANFMKGNTVLGDSLIANIEYIQDYHKYPHFYNFNRKGIVAADHNNTSTGFEWNYHNRLHVGATCWYMFAKCRKNPYYNDWYPTILQISPLNRFVPKSGGTTSFSVTSNSFWTASSDSSWCTVTPSGSGNGTIQVNCLENQSDSLRTAHITVNSGGISPIVVNVIQYGTIGKILNLKLYLEGLFNGNELNKAQNSSGDQFTGTIADQIIVELHNKLQPYNLVGIPNSTNLFIDGNASLLLSDTLNADYYIAIKHRNSIESWSKFPVPFNGISVDYDFSQSASQSYGDNLKFLLGKYVIFTGDVNQDGIVDSGDMIPVDNDGAYFVTGYLATDLNGDGLIDSTDMILLDNNAAAFVGRIIPQ